MVGAESLTTSAPFEDELFYTAADVEVHAGGDVLPWCGADQRPWAGSTHSGAVACPLAVRTSRVTHKGVAPSCRSRRSRLATVPGWIRGDLRFDAQFPAVGAADGDVGAAAPM